MADTKVSGLTAAASFLDTHELPVNEAGVSKKVTGLQIRAVGPKGTLGYVQVTANQGTFTTVVDLTSLTLTITAANSNGRRIKISAQANFSSSTATDSVQMSIQEGATVLQATSATNVGATGSASTELTTMAVLTPTNASHTYKLTAVRLLGAGNITMIAATTQPAFILIEDIGT